LLWNHYTQGANLQPSSGACEGGIPHRSTVRNGKLQGVNGI
jgi:hypothetical protein